MNPQQAAHWKNFVVGETLKAVAAHQPLSDVLIFKGARILNLHLGTNRQSLDIDSNLTPEFTSEHRDLDSQKTWLESQISPALRNYFEKQDPVRFTLLSATVRRDPPKIPHPRQWDALVVVIKVQDEKYRQVRNLPALELEIAAPEMLGPHAVTWISLDGLKLRGYALHRIAGEKLRAFLTSLPAYRTKMKSVPRPHRAKDIHDMARILAARPKEQEMFWRQAAEEFQLACQSRYVDCAGMETFLDDWEATRQTYETNVILKTVPIQEAEHALRTVVGLFERFHIFPLNFPLPPLQ
jgi:hypothetical protein